MNHENSALTPIEAERAELEVLADAMVRAPRLANLLRYIGEKYFRGESDHLNEYNIATEVFGRSKTVFDAGEDAIARVEAHRLRKRLKEFYENGGKDHPIQLSIPAGTYVPVFTRRPVSIVAAQPVELADSPRHPAWSYAEPELDTAVSNLPPAAEELHAPPVHPAGHGQQPPALSSGLAIGNWHVSRRLGMAAAVLLGLVVAGYFGYRAGHSWGSFKANAADNSGTPADAGAGSTVPSGTSAGVRPAAMTNLAPSGAPGAYPALPLRIIAGYFGKPQTDSAGDLWLADSYSHGGGLWRRGDTQISRTSDPLIFEHWRTGDFQYDIPLRPGSYELHLYFVTSEASIDNVSSFSVGINGSPVLAGFDVNSDALGANVADERIFRDVSPAADGVVHISFTSERGAPALSALAIFQGTPHRQLPIRIVTQRTSFTDHNGQFWHPDTYFMNGRLSTQRQMITGTPDPDVFASERYGHFSYAIPVDTRGRYTVILHFAELYFGQQGADTGPGHRVFRVMCNGSILLDDFDIFKEAGSMHAITRTFSHIRPSPQGKINLTFEPISNNATISGIEVIDESQ